MTIKSTDASRYQELRQMASITSRLANRKGAATESRQRAAASNEALRWAIELIEHHRPDLAAGKPIKPPPPTPRRPQ